MNRWIWACVFVAMSSSLIAAEMPHTWYKRNPLLLNGKDIPGEWDYQDGDTITTGTRGEKSRSTAKLDYPDSSTVYTLGYSEVVLHHGWIDVPVGGLMMNLVAGTSHMEHAETPLGIFRCHATTGEFYLAPHAEEKPADTRDVTAEATAGAFEWQFDLGEAAQLPRVVAWIDTGDKARYKVTPATRSIAIQSDAGDATLRLGADAALTVPAKARGTIAYDPARQVFRIEALSGELSLTTGGKLTPIAEGKSLEQVVARTSGQDQRIASRRGVPYLPPVAETVAPYAPPAAITRLPQEHDYQRVLRDYLATLNESDFDPGVQTLSVTPPSDDAEAKYRTWLLSLTLEPQVGRKRCAPSVSSPARLYLLSAIEQPDGVHRPPAWCEPLAWLSTWDYAGNAYRDSRPLKLRAFVTASVMMMMLDHAQENDPEIGVSQAAAVSSHLICYAYVYQRVSSQLPSKVREAYLSGLKKIADRVAAWGPTSEKISGDFAAAVGLYLVGESTGDSSLRGRAENYARRLVDDPRFFHPAGYFVSAGGFDGAAHASAQRFAVWLALLSDYPFLKEPLSRSYRLQAYLSLPDPDGYLGSPTHFSPFTSQETSRNKSGGERDFAAAMLVDEAAYLTRLPSEDELNGGGLKRINELKAQIRETPMATPPDQLASRPWKFIPQTTSWSFPNALNIAQDAYRPGAFARLVKLHSEPTSPNMQPPFAREEMFLKTFDKAFTIGKNLRYGVVLHTGPIGGPIDGVQSYPGPYGFGGGQLSAFWTRKTGSVILGRRGGMGVDENRDPLETWRNWPIHAVSGRRHDDLVFTTAQIREPEVEESIRGMQGTVTVRGAIPASQFDQSGALAGRFDYRRTFTIGAERLTVETLLASTGRDKLSELFETIPVFLREMKAQRKTLPTQIEFLADGKWLPAQAVYQTGVTAVRLSRFDGRVRIEFDRPRRVKLSPAEWSDQLHTRAACRNMLIDLLENGDQPAVPHEIAVRYEIVAGE